MSFSSIFVAAMTLGLIACPAFGQAAPASPNEQRLVAEFDSFVAVEWPRILEEIQTGMEHAVELKGATKLPMSRKNSYIVFWIVEQPDDHISEVIRSNSLNAPYKGIVRFNVKVSKGSIVVKGPKAHCKEKPLKECLAHGGKLADGMFSMGGDYTVEQLHEVVLSYVPGDPEWTRERDAPVLDIIATMPSVSSLDR